MNRINESNVNVSLTNKVSRNHRSFQILYHIDAIVLLYFADHHSGRILERNVDERLLYSHRFPLRLHAEYDMAGEFRGPLLRQQTLRQVSTSRLKRSSERFFFFSILNLSRKGQLSDFPDILYRSNFLLDFLEIHFRGCAIQLQLLHFPVCLTGISIRCRTKALPCSLSVKVGIITITSFPGITRRPS